MRTDCNADTLDFGRLGRRRLLADFGGGHLSSDAGTLLLRIADQKTGLTKRFFERCMADYRDPARVRHEGVELLRQRVFGLALAYEDVVDHDSLRLDPLLAAAVGKDDLDPGAPNLASSSTLYRLESTPENPAAERYARIDLDPEAADDFFVDYFVASIQQQAGGPPERVVVDLDPSDVELHGAQEGRFFHGYYGHYCYLPLYAFAGEHLLTVRLQTADGDPARHTIEVLDRIVRKLRAAWPQTRVIFRADSGFSREVIYAWLEEHRVDYVIGLARNARLEALVADELKAAEKLYETTGAAARIYAEFEYQTLDSWSRARRVVAKAEYLGKQNPRFVVTSLSSDELAPQQVYEDLYCPRGEAENRIKEQQLYLFGDRLSAGTMRANQNRLYFAGLAYLLIQAVRSLGLRGTELESARADTIRLKLLKVAALVRVSVRRVWVRMASACPYANVFRRAFAQLVAAPQLVM